LSLATDRARQRTIVGAHPVTSGATRYDLYCARYRNARRPVAIQRASATSGGARNPGAVLI